MTAVEILTQAKEILKERGINRDGWYVNRTDNPGCSVCSIGALRLAAGGKVVSEEYHEAEWDEGIQDDVDIIKVDYDVSCEDWNAADSAELYLRNALEALGYDTWPTYHGYPSYVSIPAFNDRSTSDEQVFEVFDKAIELARGV